MTPTYVESQDNTPDDYQLLYNYPNPFNNHTSIAFNQFDYGTATLEIYNIRGDRIKTIKLGALSPGNHITSWNGRNYYGKEVASGVYSYALFVNNKSVLTNKMVLLK
jgi:flagellar hook assembly protein FlgD